MKEKEQKKLFEKLKKRFWSLDFSREYNISDKQQNNEFAIREVPVKAKIWTNEQQKYLDNRFGALEQRMDNLEQRMDRMESKLDKIIELLTGHISDKDAHK